jgi:CDP-glucose 4,6-dehydratase
MYNDLVKTYKGKKVFLTGHTGFKGAWLLKTLNILGADVKGYALAPENDKNLYNLIQGDSLCESVIDDLLNRETLINSINDYQPDFIFHLAAQPLVRLSYQIPSYTFAVNAVGTANLLDGVLALTKPCNVILITTDKVYHNYEWIYPYRESDRLGGYDPYSASKACAELVIDSYRNSFFNTNNYDQHQKAIAVTRAGNVIGGGDWSKDRLIPDIAKAIGNDQKVIIRNPSSVRPWQHVLEPIVGYLMLGTKVANEPVKYSQAYNFGPYSADALPVKTMVDLAISSWGKGEYEVQQLANQPHEAGLLKLDINKAVAEVGWKPQFDAEKAIKYTIDWYKNFFDDETNANAFTEKQIVDFLSL